jgi:hypothetical protein
VERSEAVTIILARVMKTMDRSNETLLRSISHFEGVDISVKAGPKAAAPDSGSGVGPNAGSALAAVCLRAVFGWRNSPRFGYDRPSGAKSEILARFRGAAAWIPRHF